MHIVLWLLQALLAVTMLIAGGLKVARSRDDLISHPSTEGLAEYSSAFIKLIGVAEVVGSFGLILPGLFGLAPDLTPLAALGLAAILLGATKFHRRRNESPAVAGALLAIAIVISVGRLAFAPLG